ncbi:tetratricopeptide repeat protein [Nostoc sp. ChiQUE01b]|uniref:tetratricopeptide repeat protein n=1 Tax=Nostoc sp. ChiQUE01b TaxID=3075376 RepID=UPI002AD32A3D|nr:tetratricopeptide repeat protein [Nostoc sp. ChiQUE01b]MDZ8262564.1 tetratricopeptide repeat protein [Nostoc sp. ChiQUE01b]
MTVLTCASTGQSITLLGEPLANSGEGKVWRTNRNGYLAKIYHSPTPEHVQKLAVMITHRPKEPNSHLNHISFAWPKSVLKDAQANCVGFLMPEIKEAKELIDVYNPKKRKDLKLNVDWRFFHTTALNITSIIEAIHISGYVLGDIKPQNILVNDRALPSIIDTDSFQVRNPKNNKVYRCLVGTDGFTPPELIDKDFSSIDQTEVHDRFRLAVIIYQLLFGGESPFAGKWIGAGETPETNELIRRGLWLYAPNSLIQPVERTIPLEIVHPEVQRCFLRCFNNGYKNSNLRPTAGDWVKALRLAVNELTICGKVDSHYYSRTYGKCYWCDRSTKLGIDIFPIFPKKRILCKDEDADAYNNRGFRRYLVGDTQGAINDYNQALRMNPNHAIAYNNRGLAHSALGDKERAINDCNEALRIDPNFTQAYINLLIIRYKMIALILIGLIAVSSLSLIIFANNLNSATNSNLDKDYVNRCSDHVNLKNYSEAIDDCNEAVKINPNNDEAYFLRCSAHFHLKDYSEAINDCNGAVKINPNNDKAYFVRGASHIMNGNKPQGMGDLRKAISLENEAAKEILTDIQQ